MNCVCIRIVNLLNENIYYVILICYFFIFI